MNFSKITFLTTTFFMNTMYIIRIVCAYLRLLSHINPSPTCLLLDIKLVLTDFWQNIPILVNPYELYSNAVWRQIFYYTVYSSILSKDLVKRERKKGQKEIKDPLMGFGQVYSSRGTGRIKTASAG